MSDVTHRAIAVAHAHGLTDTVRVAQGVISRVFSDNIKQTLGTGQKNEIGREGHASKAHDR